MLQPHHRYTHRISTIIFHICMIDCGIGNVQFCLKIELTSFCSCSYRKLNFAVTVTVIKDILISVVKSITCNCGYG